MTAGHFQKMGKAAFLIYLTTGGYAGDPTSHVPFYSHKLPAFHGKASVIIRRTAPGPIKVSAKANGLKKTTVVVTE